MNFSLYHKNELKFISYSIFHNTNSIPLNIHIIIVILFKTVTYLLLQNFHTWIFLRNENLHRYWKYFGHPPFTHPLLSEKIGPNVFRISAMLTLYTHKALLTSFSFHTMSIRIMEMEIYQTFCDIMLEYCNVYYLLGFLCAQKGVIEGNMKMIALNGIHLCLLIKLYFMK